MPYNLYTDTPPPHLSSVYHTACIVSIHWPAILLISGCEHILDAPFARIDHKMVAPIIIQQPH